LIDGGHRESLSNRGERLIPLSPAGQDVVD
jgi:hypothetical protein